MVDRVPGTVNRETGALGIILSQPLSLNSEVAFRFLRRNQTKTSQTRIEHTKTERQASIKNRKCEADSSLATSLLVETWAV